MPFSRAVVEIGEPVYIDAGVPKERLAEYDRRVQEALDELR